MGRESFPDFDRLALALHSEGGIDPPPVRASGAFGAFAMKVGGKIFAMPVGGRLVLKLPKAHVDALVAAGSGIRFDPGHGRIMKEWIALTTVPPSQWLTLAREARSFAGGQAAD